MDEELKKNMLERKTWLRGLYILLFLILYAVAKIIIFAIIAFQFVLILITGKPNEQLVKLGQGLSTYSYQILTFLTFNSDYHPYPLGTWPEGEPDVEEEKSGTDVKPKSKTKTKSKKKIKSKKENNNENDTK